MSELTAVRRKPTAAEIASSNRRSKVFGEQRRKTLNTQGEQFRKALGTSAGRVKDPMLAQPSSFKKGGKVEKTGMAKVHKGEVVLTKKQAKKPSIKKAIKKK